MRALRDISADSCNLSHANRSSGMREIRQWYLSFLKYFNTFYKYDTIIFQARATTLVVVTAKVGPETVAKVEKVRPVGTSFVRFVATSTCFAI